MGDLSKIRINGTLYDLKDATARQEVAQCVNNGTYDSNSKKILLKHGNTVVVQIDATDFIKDGMVSSVVIQNGNLVITFNTDAGQEPIVIPLTDIFNPNNYYTKSQVDDIVIADVIRTQSDATFVNSSNQPVFYLRQASSTLAGLMTSDEHNKLSDLPSNSELTQTLNGKVGIVDNGAYDVTVHNSNATFASLQALLNSENLSTLIPADVRKGGMSIKFVQSSDNKYVQYRLMSNTFSTTESNWQGVDDVPIVGSKNLVESGGLANTYGSYVENSDFIKVETDSKGRILWAVRKNADIFYGFGVPTQIIEFINNKIIELGLNNVNSIITFLDEYISNTTLQNLLADKADKNNTELSGKISIDKEVDDNDEINEMSVQHIENTEFIGVWLDKHRRILFGVQQDANFFFGYGVPRQIVDFVNSFKSELLSIINNKVDKEEGKGLIDSEIAKNHSYIYDSERIEIETDKVNKILEVTDINGNKIIFGNLEVKGKLINSNIIHNNKVEQLKLYWENGIYNGRTAIASNDGVRVPEIKGAGLYMLTFGDDYYTVIKNSKYTFTVYHPTSIFLEDTDDYLCVYLRRKDGTYLTTNNFDSNDVDIYYLNGSNSSNSKYDIVISASDSYEKEKNGSDITVDGTNDNRILASLFGSTNTVNVLLLEGTYNINEFWTTSGGTAKCALPIFKNSTIYRTINIKGNIPCRIGIYARKVRFLVSQSLHESVSTTENCNYFIIAIPYEYGMGTPDITKRLGFERVVVNFSNFLVQGYMYDKPITYIDTTVCSATMIKQVSVHSWLENASTTHDFNDTPNKDCVGFRIGRGSNNGVQNYLKNAVSFYCYKGVAVNGEHFVFEDVMTHHCYIGWYFGDRYTTGALEHPNVMIGCSIEGCYRLMILSGCGIESSEQYYDVWPDIVFGSTLVCIGLSTEKSWAIPINEREEGEPTTATTLPIKEIVRPRTDTNPYSYSSYWRGRIEGDDVESEENMTINIIHKQTQEAITMVADSCKRFKFLNYKNL